MSEEVESLLTSPCPDCCECPPPILRTAARSKSTTKCLYFPEWTSPSTPPKYYLRNTKHNQVRWENVSYIDGGHAPGIWDHVDGGIVGGVFEFEASRTVNIDPDNFCTQSVTPKPDSYNVMFFRRDTYGCCPDSEGCEKPEDTYYEEVGSTFEWDQYRGIASDAHSQTVYTRTVDIDDSQAPTPTQYCDGYPGAGIQYFIDKYQATYTETLSLEYTTDLLITHLLAGLESGAYGAWSGSSVVTGGLLTYFVISEDETTAAAYQEKYRFRHKVSRMGSGCYRILWDQVYVPKCGLALGSIESANPIGGYTPGDEIEVTISPPNIGGVPCPWVQATATATANAEGVLEFTLTEAGSGYGADVAATVDGHGLIVHLTSAELEEYQFPGDVPEGYDPMNPETWPESPVLEPALPEGITAENVGAIYFMNARSVYRGCT